MRSALGLQLLQSQDPDIVKEGINLLIQTIENQEQKQTQERFRVAIAGSENLSDTEKFRLSMLPYDDAIAAYKEFAGPESEELVQVMGPDGEPVYMRRSRAAGQRAPADSPLVNITNAPSGYRFADPSNPATSPLEAVEGGPADPARETEKQRNDRVKAEQTFRNLETQFDKYQSLLGRVGTEVLPGKDKNELNTRRTQILLELKTLNELGAITGPDMDLMNALVLDPTTPVNALRDAWAKVTGGATAGQQAISNIDVLRDIAQDRIKAAQGGLAAPEPTTSPDPNALTIEELKALSEEDIRRMMEELQ